VYWRRRLEQHTADNYMGVPMSKFPEDLRVYERLLWESRANVVIELGVFAGGSTLWFRDRLRALAERGRITLEPLVVAVDTATRPDDLPRDVIFLREDVTDPALPKRVATLLPAGARVFVVEDTAHEYDTTMAALKGFGRFVPTGGFFVVEDGVVDVEELRVDPAWPRGVAPAIRDWLATDPGFVVRRDLELYGVTCHPGGFLQRVD
jgi:cephalosporin hydroxylase